MQLFLYVLSYIDEGDFIFGIHFGMIKEDDHDKHYINLSFGIGAIEIGFNVH